MISSEYVSYEPFWTFSVREGLEGLLEDWDLTPEDLSLKTGVCLCDIQAFLNEETDDLTPAQYVQIETALKLPVNYFARLKAMYAERAEKLNLSQG